MPDGCSGADASCSGPLQRSEGRSKVSKRRETHILSKKVTWCSPSLPVKHEFWSYSGGRRSRYSKNDWMQHEIPREAGFPATLGRTGPGGTQGDKVCSQSSNTAARANAIASALWGDLVYRMQRVQRENQSSRSVFVMSGP